jgi:hypothetical protein
VVDSLEQEYQIQKRIISTTTPNATTGKKSNVTAAKVKRLPTDRTTNKELTKVIYELQAHPESRLEAHTQRSVGNVSKIFTTVPLTLDLAAAGLSLPN